MLFSFAYLAASASTCLRTMSYIGVYHFEISFHCLPSHCWKMTGPPPS